MSSELSASQYCYPLLSFLLAADINLPPPSDGISSVSFSPDSSRLLVSSWDGVSAKALTFESAALLSLSPAVALHPRRLQPLRRPKAAAIVSSACRNRVLDRLAETASWTL